MKHIYTFLLLLINVSLLAQSPQSFSYQAVARDATGNIIADGQISLRISILYSSSQGQPVYVETHFTTTNQFGLVAINIGEGTTTYGQFDTIPWNIGTYFIQTELDATGGANYLLMGTNQILSVPYAIYGRDEDYDTINELQSLTFANDSLSLSKSNKVEIPLGYLGELRMFAVSISGAITKQALQQRGWAICDGTTPVSQGITNPLLASTPNLVSRFIKMSDDESCGNTGGTETHNHGGATGYTVDYGSNGKWEYRGYPNGKWHKHEISSNNHLPPYYEALFFIKVR